MKKEYNFKKGKRGVYNDRLQQEKITIRLDQDIVLYFKEMAKQKGLPYQTLINLYLRSCKDEKLIPEIDWKKEAQFCEQKDKKPDPFPFQFIGSDEGVVQCVMGRAVKSKSKTNSTDVFLIEDKHPIIEPGDEDDIPIPGPPTNECWDID